MNRLKSLWDTIRHINMYIMKIPEGPEKKSMLNAPKLTKFDKIYIYIKYIHLYIQEAQKTPNRCYTKISIPKQSRVEL